MASCGIDVVLAMWALVCGKPPEKRPSSSRYESRAHGLAVGGSLYEVCGRSVITWWGAVSGAPGRKYTSEVNATSGNRTPRT